MSDNKDEAISSGCHSVLALSKIKSLREQSTLCDIILEVGGTEIPAHKVILAASSPYFEFMFTSSNVEESSKERIQIKGFCPKAFLALVDFMYSGYLLVNEETIVDLLKVADFLRIATAKERCLNYLQKHINVSNCVMIRNIARNHFFVELEKKVNNFITHNILDVIKSSGFLELSFDQLKCFITEDSFCCDESICGKVISSWIHHHRDSREELRESISQVASVYIESREQRGLNVYDASRHRRIFFFYDNADYSNAIDLDNLTLQCVRRGPISQYNQPIFHNNSICLISPDKNKCGIYNLKEEKWTSNTMPFKNSYSGGCSDHNRIYLTSSGDSRDTLSYEVERNALYTEPPLIRKRTKPGVTFNENCIYVCGGGSCSAEFRDIRTKDWRPISYLPSKSEDVSSTSLYNKIYCLSTYGNLFQYDKCNGVWMEKAAVPAKETPPMKQLRVILHPTFSTSDSIDTKRYTIGSTDEALYACYGEELYKYDVNKDEWTVLISKLTAPDFVCVYPRL